MGCKRDLEANEFEDLPLKKVKDIEYIDKLAACVDIDTPNIANVKPVISGEYLAGFYNIQWYDALETDTASEVPHSGDKHAKTSGHFSSSSSEDDTGSGETSLSSVSSDCWEFDYPHKAYIPLDDPCSVLDRSPRRIVPVGPNHQASIPVWTGRLNKVSDSKGTYSHDSPSSGDDLEEKLMGTPMISMPDSSINSLKSDKVGEGRTECNCLDRGSIRCVRQHVREARENLRKTLGNENFVNLGFSDMGEEVALKWSEEEEEIFHEVVYNNPATLGRNFWQQLSVTFPSRTKKEIVSYYYNVFMLRRRAAQNRSRSLDIDSDDDECHIGNAGLCDFATSEEDDGAIEFLEDQHIRDNCFEEDDCVDDDSADGSNSSDIDSAGYDTGNITEEEDGIDQRSLIACKENSQIEQRCDGISGIAKADFSVQDDSCMSFECQTQTNTEDKSHRPMVATDDLQASSFKCDKSPHMTDHVYFLDPCDVTDWCPGYPTTPTTDDDFLSTSNLIEEFFGLGTPDKRDKQ